jgi:hypothetical protein
MTDPSTRSYGIDVSAPVTADQWSCLAGRNCRFAVVRCYRNADGGEPDANCPATVAGGWAAGMQAMDVYHFPVITAKTASDQATEALAFLAENDVRFGRLWLDIEGDTTSGTWSPDVTYNIDFIADFLTTVRHAGVAAGIYCSTATWTAITGNTRAFGHVPLWWSSHGATFTALGGWSAPLVIQYAYETMHCGLDYDSDYTDELASLASPGSIGSIGSIPASGALVELQGILTLRRR